MRDKVQATISYKTKVKETADGQKYIDYKVNISKTDCNLKPHQHAYYNSDMFNSMLKRAVQSVQRNKSWCYISELPEAITIDTKGFLSTVTISIEV